MEKTKAFLEAHYKRYIFTICLLWFLMFFLPWDWQIGRSFSILFRYEKTLCGFGVLSILYSVLIKKIQSSHLWHHLLLGLLDQSLWYFGILPAFLGN